MTCSRHVVERRKNWVRGSVTLAVAPLVLFACSTTSPGDDNPTSPGDANPPGGDDFPAQEIRVITGGGPGGGLDTAARQIEPALSDALGVPVRVENHTGGNWAIATAEFLNSGKECHAITFAAFPHIFGSYLAQDVDYTYDDFAAIGANIIQPGLIRVRNDAPWETLSEMVEDAKENPDTIRVSVSGSTSSNYIGITDIEEATGAQFNVVPYEGEGPESRVALLSGEVDAVHAGVFNTLELAEDTKVLALQQDENRWPELTNDAPTVNEELGTDLPPNQSTYGLFASTECAENYPDRYQTLIEAYQTAVEDPDYLQTLEELDQLSKLYVAGPEEYDEELRADLEAFKAVLEQSDQ